MKKIGLILLSGVLVLSAVEWEVEQVTDFPGRYSFDPVLSLEGETPTILFEQDDESGYDFLKLAYKDNGSWVTEEVLEVVAVWFDFTMDSSGNLYIAFTERIGEPGENDLFLATDTSGEIVLHRLTEDAIGYQYPMIELDENDNVHIVYAGGGGEFHGDWIQYGYFEGDQFTSEVVTEDMSGTYNSDLVLSSGGIPHVFYGFYTEADGEGLMHSYRTVTEEWSEEIILPQPWVRPSDPSASVDQEGRFHVSYDYNSSYICYITDKSGSWQNEWVSDTFETYGHNDESSIALDPEGYPHIAWSFAPEEDAFYDIHYSRKLAGIWTEEPVTETPERYEESDDNHYFQIDDRGYGHMVFAGYELAGEQEIAEIYYAKSTEPLESSFVAEDTPTRCLDELEIRGSSVVLTLRRASNVQIKLYDASGRFAKVVFSGRCLAGSQSIPIELSGLSSGVYFVKARIGEKATTAKYLLIR